MLQEDFFVSDDNMDEQSSKSPVVIKLYQVVNTVTNNMVSEPYQRTEDLSSELRTFRDSRSDSGSRVSHRRMTLMQKYLDLFV